VLAKRDAIGIDLCEVSVAGIDRPIQVRRRSDGNLRVGDDVFLTLNPEHVLVFAKD
jgi:iron(III) transport system ATP-binding protein